MQSSTSTTDTVYVGGLEQVTTTTPQGGQPSTSIIAYYGNVALAVNGALSYLGSDALGSAEVALTPDGHSQASQLFTPYGTPRYSSGTFPTQQAFTGYLADSATGLDYATARYYDPTSGAFTSADTTSAGGLNRYAYVGGSPETFTDPSGHALCDNDCARGVAEAVEETTIDEEITAGAGQAFADEALVGVEPTEGAGGAPANSNEWDTTYPDGESTNVVKVDGKEVGRYADIDGTEVYEPLDDPTNPDSIEQTQQADGESTHARIESAENATENASSSGSSGSGSSSGTSGGGTGTTEGGGGTGGTPAPTEPVTTDQDYYRPGNTTSPQTDNLRPGKEFPDPNDPTVPGKGGYGPSFYNQPPEGLTDSDLRRIWYLPAGTELPEGYEMVYSPDDQGAARGFNGNDHYVLQPTEDVSVDDMREDMKIVNGRMIRYK